MPYSRLFVFALFWSQTVIDECILTDNSLVVVTFHGNLLSKLDAYLNIEYIPKFWDFGRHLIPIHFTVSWVSNIPSVIFIWAKDGFK